MMKDEKVDVVITNPTHYAVVLAMMPLCILPDALAKGADNWPKE